MRKIQLALATSCLALLAAAASAGTPPALTTQRVASGLSLPLYVTHAPGDFTRLYIVQQGSAGSAQIRILNLATGLLNASPFLTLNGISTGGERGLLGLAFDPDFQNNSRFYVYYSAAANSNVVARGTAATPDMANPALEVILSMADPFSNHNGGWIGFGPDGYLYVATGDGGSANDPQGNAQNVNSLLGKMLRLDVSGATGYTNPPSNPFFGATNGRDEIWAYGLRNPWRNSFDRETGDLYIGDVGQNAWEEIDFQPASSTGGENYGWRCMEGNACTGLSGCTCNDVALTDPIHVYSHGQGCSITGGYVYRGCAIPGLEGTYFFADYCANTIWSFEYVGGVVTNFTNRTTELDPPGILSIGSITSFGEDAYGEIYIVDQGGEVFKILPAAGIVDGNGNGVADSCEGTVCGGDLDGDGDTDLGDLGILLADFGCAGQCSGDLDGDGDTDLGDLGIVLANFGCGK